MKQVLQDPRSGEVQVAEVPAPQLLPGCVLVRIAASLVSAGTERASSEFASKNLVQKAQARPDLVREVLNKFRRDGLLSTLQAVRTRLDQPTALGYSSAGRVVAVGEGVTDIVVGDRVACAGAGHAVHAEVACVPRLLCAKLPEGRVQVSLEEAAFTTVGAVALHGIRVAEVKLGEVVGVIGLGLLGQLTVQMLKAAGCRVLGMDIDPERAQMAVRSGAVAATSSGKDFQDLCLQHTHGFGPDAVLVTAETASSDPVNLAGQVARDRAVVVAVGTVGMEIERKAYYEKELDFRISRSYGPGRYDAVYEQKGRDYPIGYVRWTETRNMDGFLQLLADGKLDVKSLITHRVPVAEADRAYHIITGKSREPFLGVIFTYPQDSEISERVNLASALSASARPAQGSVAAGVLGVGGFAMGTLLPAMKQIRGVEFVACCAATGAHSRSAGDKFGFRYCTTSEVQVLQDPSLNTVVIATRHHLHARQVLAALAAGKNVFCEKPLCLTEEELAQIVDALHGSTQPQPLLMVGFNRRFAPMAMQMKDFLNVSEPLVMHYRVNAGFIPADHWVHDPEQGGGRIRGEVCHFVDFLAFLAGAPPVSVEAQPLPNSGRYSDDNIVVSLRFENGSLGTIHYVANGDKSFSKERVEVFGGGAVATLEDFRRLELVRSGRSRVVQSRTTQDKGHVGEWQAFAESIRSGKPAPISVLEIVASTLATLRIALSRSTGAPQLVNVRAFLASANGQPQI